MWPAPQQQWGGGWPAPQRYPSMGGQTDWAVLAQQWVQQKNAMDTALQPPLPPPDEDVTVTQGEVGINVIPPPVVGSNNTSTMEISMMVDPAFIMQQQWGLMGAVASQQIPVSPGEITKLMSAQMFDYGHGSSTPRSPVTGPLLPTPGPPAAVPPQPTTDIPPTPAAAAIDPLIHHMAVQTFEYDHGHKSPEQEPRMSWRARQFENMIVPPEEPHSSDEEATKTQESAKKKKLPLWIRQELERMEADKQRQLEKAAIRRETEEQREIASQRLSLENTDENINSPSQVKSKFDDSEDETESEDGLNRLHPDDEIDPQGDQSAESIPQINDIVTHNDLGGIIQDDSEEEETEEEKQQRIMLTVRWLLTDILLDVTDSELQDVVVEIFKKTKRKKVTGKVLNSSDALIALKKSGVVDYGTDESEVDKSSNNENESETDDEDSDSEMKAQERRLAYEKHIKELESEAGSESSPPTPQRENNSRSENVESATKETEVDVEPESDLSKNDRRSSYIGQGESSPGRGREQHSKSRTRNKDSRKVSSHEESPLRKSRKKGVNEGGEREERKGTRGKRRHHHHHHHHTTTESSSSTEETTDNHSSRRNSKNKKKNKTSDSYHTSESSRSHHRSQGRHRSNRSSDSDNNSERSHSMKKSSYRSRSRSRSKRYRR